MVVARNLALGRTEHRLVAEQQRAVGDLDRNMAPAVGRRRGIVVACDPDEARAS